jgi:Flp pilus assembly protein TadG
VNEEHGGAMVEFAVVAGLIFIPIVFGILEFGRIVWARDMITSAAREGTRYAVVHGAQSSAPFDSAAVASYVQGRTQLSPIGVKTTWTTDRSAGDTVVVTVTYVYVPIVKVPGLLTSKTITAKSTQVVWF